ncbi:MAG: hypothetical protein RIS44_3410, partial [Pseudomonadota bacterium]
QLVLDHFALLTRVHLHFLSGVDSPFMLKCQIKSRLVQVIALGYLRGIVQQLDSIERAAPATASFVAHMRELARSFQLDAMSGVLRKADHESESH